MVYFGEYLKDYLEYNKISQTEFALRMGVTQKHINDIISGRQKITLEVAASIERLTGISSSFIILVENVRYIEEELTKEYGSVENINKMLKEDYCLNELKRKKWISFKDETNPIQLSIDILDFLKVRNFVAHNNLKNYVLFKKTGEDYNKLALWIARCDELSSKQIVNEYDNSKFNELIKELLKYSYTANYEIYKICKILNSYGILFVSEKALSGTKVRGCFKVKAKTPAIYITSNYSGKDSFYFELFHELGHCKSDYNMAQNKTIIDGDEEREKRADQFALEVMISNDAWCEILKDISENSLLEISKKYRIPMSFIVGRLAKNNFIKYNSILYNKYKLV